MKTRVLPYFEGRAVGSLTRLDVRAWIVQLQAAGLAASTVRKCYQLAARVFDEAVESSMIGTSPCRRIELPQEARRQSVLLGADDVAALADAVPPQYRALILTAAYTGLRWGELAGLREERLDLDRRRIDVAEILIEVDGALSFGPPKTKKSHAQVSLPTPLVFVIRRHLAEHADTDRTRRLIFTSDDSTPLRRSNFRRRVWLPAIEATGLPTSATFHALRHTCASWLIADEPTPWRSPKSSATRACRRRSACTATSSRGSIRSSIRSSKPLRGERARCRLDEVSDPTGYWRGPNQRRTRIRHPSQGA